MNAEYVRNLHSNYVRILLDGKPEEKKYQYCILSRGGIKGLLSCSLRYLDGGAYLYYDITSKQNLTQLYQKGNISREWLLDFMGSFKRLQRELERFLLREENVVWNPKHVFQDLENPVFSFLYVPYCEEENSFLPFLSFLVEKIDYDDQELVECVYKMYEQYEKNGETYLQEQIFKDVKVLEKRRETEKTEETKLVRKLDNEDAWKLMERSDALERTSVTESTGTESPKASEEPGGSAERAASGASKKLFGFFENKRSKKTKEQERRTEYQENMQQLLGGYAVAEETEYEEGYGRTTFLTQKTEKKEHVHRLYYADGRKASDLVTPNLLIGKYKEKVDLYLSDDSVSRMHARVLKDQDDYYLEDENSTNGTYCNKDRLQPYEKKKLTPGDEVGIGNIILFFR